MTTQTEQRKPLPVAEEVYRYLCEWDESRTQNEIAAALGSIPDTWIWAALNTLTFERKIARQGVHYWIP